jgi:cytochrome c peroxidase
MNGRIWLLAFVLVGLALALPVQKDPDIEAMDMVSLGERLFNDPILSRDSTIACASCHRPAFAFADTVAFSVGITGQPTRRNTPSAMNMLDRSVFMWDGRAATLQDQALLPLEHPDEMGFHRDSVVLRLRQHPFYAAAFQRVFQRTPHLEDMLDAIAAFEESLETADTPNDRWLFDREPGLTEVQIRGRDLFMDKANCITCHFTPDFTGDEFRNIGLYNGKDLNDTGRFEQTRDSSDLGKFKVPGLRNVAVTAPYMHNGMFKTLAEVIRFYNDPAQFVDRALNVDPEIKPLGLTDTEMFELEQFLIGLTDDRFVHLLQHR